MFYNPITILPEHYSTLTIRPIIVYPEEGLERLLNRRMPGVIPAHLHRVYRAHPDAVQTGDFQIIVLSASQKSLLTHVFSYGIAGKNEYRIPNRMNVFRDTNRTNFNGIRLPKGTEVITRAEEALRLESTDAMAFAMAIRPSIGCELSLDEDFYA